MIQSNLSSKHVVYNYLNLKKVNIKQYQTGADVVLLLNVPKLFHLANIFRKLVKQTLLDCEFLSSAWFRDAQYAKQDMIRNTSLSRAQEIHLPCGQKALVRMVGRADFS